MANPTPTSKPSTRVFAQPGMLAIEPAAFGLAFLECDNSPDAGLFELVADGAVAVVDIQGPLMSTGGWCFDGYPDIRQRVQAALASEAHTVALRLDTPGGEVYGCFDTAAAIRDDCAAAGKRLVAHTAGRANSAGYALMVAASYTAASESASVGSVGVIATLPEFSRANDAAGITVNILKSGERKDDGSPIVPMSDDARASLQGNVDAMAEIFFRWVGAQRKMTPAAVAALQASIYLGADAVTAGLVDAAMPWDEFLALVASQEPGAILTEPGTPSPSSEESQAMDAQTSPAAVSPAAGTPHAEDDSGDDKETVRARLARAADEGDENAKRALAAYDDEPDPDAEDDKPDPDAEDDAPPPSDDDDDKGDDAKAVAAAEATARAAICDGLPSAMVKALATVPLAQLPGIVKAIPRGAADAMVPKLERPPLRGAAPGATPEAVPADEMSIRMGLVSQERKVIDEGPVQRLGVLQPISPKESK